MKLSEKILLISALLFIFLIFIATPASAIATTTVKMSDKTGAVGEQITLSAKYGVSDLAYFNPVKGEKIRFYVNGEYIGSDLTNPDGVAEVTYTPPGTGDFNIKAEASDAANEATLHVVSSLPISFGTCYKINSTTGGVVDKKENFTPEDGQVTAYSKWKSLNKGDKVTIKFKTPNGGIYYSHTNTIPGDGDWIVYEKIDISNLPDYQLGEWQALHYYNGKLEKTDIFEIKNLKPIIWRFWMQLVVKSLVTHYLSAFLLVCC